MKFDPRTYTPENFWVTLQTKPKKAYPDPDSPPACPITTYATNPAVARTPFDQESASQRKKRSAQQARSVQIRQNFVKNKPVWLCAKLLEQLENITLEDFSVFG